MENRDYIKEELLEIAPSIVQIGKVNMYSVSPDYFDELSTAILDKIRGGQEVTYYFPRSMPYKTPVGYFEENAKSILQRIQEETKKSEVFTEMESISPLLNTVSKNNVYTVPEGYLERAIVKPVTSTINELPTVRIIPDFRKIIKYSAAAVITAFMAIGMYLLVNNNGTTGSVKNNPTAAVKKLSEDEIANFLKTNFATEDATTVNYGSSLKESDIKKSVKEMSDKEIQQFLQDEGEVEEI